MTNLANNLHTAALLTVVTANRGRLSVFDAHRLNWAENNTRTLIRELARLDAGLDFDGAALTKVSRFQRHDLPAMARKLRSASGDLLIDAELI